MLFRSIGTKGNGNIYASGPGFYFTDGATTYASCATQLTGTVTTSTFFDTFDNPIPLYHAAWLTGNKFSIKLIGTTVTITGGSNAGNYLVTGATSTLLTFDPTGAEPGSNTGVTYTSNFPSRGDCVEPMIAFYNVKNLGELKSVVRMLDEGNIRENNWVGQSDESGYGLLIDPKNPNDTCPVCQVVDVTYRYNFTRNITIGGVLAIDPATQ